MNTIVKVLHWWCIACGHDWVGDAKANECPECYSDNTTSELV